MKDPPVIAMYRHVHPRRKRPPEYWGARQALDIAKKKRRAALRRRRQSQSASD